VNVSVTINSKEVWNFITAVRII